MTNVPEANSGARLFAGGSRLGVILGSCFLPFPVFYVGFIAFVIWKDVVKVS